MSFRRPDLSLGIKFLSYVFDRYAVTGASACLGRPLVKKLLDFGYNVKVLALHP